MACWLRTHYETACRAGIEINLTNFVRSGTFDGLGSGGIAYIVACVDDTTKLVG